MEKTYFIGNADNSLRDTLEITTEVRKCVYGDEDIYMLPNENSENLENLKEQILKDWKKENEELKEDYGYEQSLSDYISKTYPNTFGEYIDMDKICLICNIDNGQEEIEILTGDELADNADFENVNYIDSYWDGHNFKKYIVSVGNEPVQITIDEDKTTNLDTWDGRNFQFDGMGKHAEANRIESDNDYRNLQGDILVHHYSQWEGSRDYALILDDDEFNEFVVENNPACDIRAQDLEHTINIR